jgi:hypothetical protein
MVKTGRLPLVVSDVVDSLDPTTVEVRYADGAEQ